MLLVSYERLSSIAELLLITERILHVLILVFNIMILSIKHEIQNK